MNWDRVEGNWKQVMGQAREKWGELSNSDLERAAGRRDQIVGIVQEKYGIAKDEAQKQVDEWAKALKDEQKAEERAEKTGSAGRF
jgi:uncharacterized protein YjbJ (UPF0337 family)